MVHRVRSLLVKERTAQINQIRGLLAEYGITMPLSPSAVRKTLPVILDDDTNELTLLGREILADLYTKLTGLEERIAHYNRHIQRIALASVPVMRLTHIRGIGAQTASALVAAAGNAKDFKNGRQFAAWLGLVPRQNSSGGKDRLLGISKRGDVYLRTRLVHGARAMLLSCQNKSDPLSRWVNRIRAEKGMNVAAVALANKNARVVWALLSREQDYRAAA
jgi:transposase